MDYYVSLSGSDANPGSLSQPFRTIQRAADAMIAGDNCWIHTGTYLEQVESRANGLIGFEITFRPFGDGMVTIDGQQIRSWGFRITHNYNTVHGFAPDGITRMLTIREAAIDCVLIVGGDVRGSVEHNTVRGCFLRDWGFAGGPFEMYAAAAVRARWGGSYTTVEYNIITRAKYPLSGNEEAAVHFWKTYGGHKVRYNYIDGRRADGSFGLYDGIGGGSPDMAANGGLFENSEVDHNVIISTADDLIEAEGRSANIQIHHNILDSRGGRTGIGLAPVTVGPVTIHHNLIINHVDTAFKFASTVAISGGTIRIYNNTVVNHPTLLSEGLAPNALATSGGTLQVRNVTCLNNIFWARRYILESVNALDEIFLDYCAVFSKDRGRDGILIGGTFFGPIKWHSTQYSYPGWLNAVKSDNQQINGFYGEALFANQQLILVEGDTFDNIIATQSPFELGPASPCVDSGTVLPGINDNYGGLAPDMGYLESPYVGAPTAQFMVTPLSGDAPLTVNITDMTLGVAVTEEVWDYGDGTGETVAGIRGTFTHIYNNPGTYTITMVATGPGGTSVAPPVTVNVTQPVVLTIQAGPGGNTNPVPGIYNYSAGATVTVTAIPNGGYYFKQWLANGQPLTINPLPLTLAGDVLLEAQFELVPVPPTQYVVTVTAMPGGLTNPAPGAYTADQGSLFPVVALPSSGYEFDHWEGDVSGTLLSITLTVNGSNLSVVAVFRQVPVVPPAPSGVNWVAIATVVGAVAAVAAVISQRK